MTFGTTLVVPLPPGENPFAVKINNNNNILIMSLATMQFLLKMTITIPSYNLISLIHLIHHFKL
jgi:hypothetical protein